jgi:uncharacterized protein YndB with AHSA1/START domain
MYPQVNTKLKILKPVNEVFEAVVDPAKMSHYCFHRGLEDCNKARRLH